MRIGIEAGAADMAPSGTRRYVEQLVLALVDKLEKDDDSLYLYHRRPSPDAMLQSVDHPAVHHRWVPLLAHQHLRMQLALPRALKRDRIDVFHAPAYFAPLLAGVPLAATFFDVSWWDRKVDWWRPGTRRAFVDLSVQTRAVRRRAEAIITLSHASKERIQARLGGTAESIHVVPPAPAPVFFTEAEPVAAAPFFLCVGTLTPHKNHVGALRALARARARGCQATMLFVGPDFCNFRDRTLLPLARDLGVTDSVSFLHDAGDRRLRDLYASAIALVFPSFVEGFGLPILEAMAAGSPVITSSVSAMPEAAGGAAILVDPGDDIATADAMCQLASDAAFRREWVAAGRQRAAEFTWEGTAQRMWEIYRDLAHVGKQ